MTNECTAGDGVTEVGFFLFKKRQIQSRVQRKAFNVKHRGYCDRLIRGNEFVF